MDRLIRTVLNKLYVVLILTFVHALFSVKWNNYNIYIIIVN